MKAHTTMSQLYRILYCSRSAVETDVGEIGLILAASRENNARDGVTGGLFFSSQCFAQVLEGPSDMVEQVFERIQGDERHCEVTVLDAGPIAKRDFPQWSMAFAGSTDPFAFGDVLMSTAFSGQTQAGDQVLDLLRGVVVREDEWLNSEAA